MWPFFSFSTVPVIARIDTHQNPSNGWRDRIFIADEFGPFCLIMFSKSLQAIIIKMNHLITQPTFLDGRTVRQTNMQSSRANLLKGDGQLDALHLFGSLKGAQILAGLCGYRWVIMGRVSWCHLIELLTPLSPVKPVLVVKWLFIAKKTAVKTHFSVYLSFTNLSSPNYPWPATKWKI